MWSLFHFLLIVDLNGIVVGKRALYPLTCRMDCQPDRIPILEGGAGRDHEIIPVACVVKGHGLSLTVGQDRRFLDVIIIKKFLVMR